MAVVATKPRPFYDAAYRAVLAKLFRNKKLVIYTCLGANQKLRHARGVGGSFDFCDKM